MLSRIYVDNYGPLVNFALPLAREQLFLGRNGAGKSSVLDAVDAVTRFVRGEGTVEELFPSRRKTRWDSRPEQTFELDVQHPSGDTYRYRLVIEHDPKRDLRRVREEQVSVGTQPAKQVLFLAQQGNAQLFHDNGTAGPEVLADWSRSSLPAIHERADNTKLTWLKRVLSRIRVASPDPRRLVAFSEREEAAPTRDLSNFASWYRHLSQEYPDSPAAMRTALQEILPGFHAIRLVAEGNGRRLITQWKTEAEATPLDLSLDELSDGQRVLLALAALSSEPEREVTTLFLDEPDNFVALSEIQPLLMSLRIRAGLQLIVISHHPEVINLQAAEHGLVFERDGLGPTRFRPFSAPADSTLTPAEIVARGEV